MSAGFHIQGRPVPLNLIGPLVETAGADPLGQLTDQGYLLLRGVHDRRAVEAARQEVHDRLADVDEIERPVEGALATGRSKRADLHPDLGAFWRSVSEGHALRHVVHGAPIKAYMSRLFDAPAAHFSFVWLRAMARGRASPLHVDHPYMSRGTQRLVTVWTPLGSVGFDEGPLFIVEGSHRWADLRQRFEGVDVDRDAGAAGHIKDDPIDIAAAHGARLLTARFEPGDALIFGMFTAHAAFDNLSAAGKVRISCDTRFQPAGEPMDERFTGDDPPAHGGLGYGCLSAARPLTAAPVVR